MRNIIWENLTKNILIILILIVAWSQIQTFFSTASLDKASVGSMLGAISILIVTACFGNFAFTYEKVNHRHLGYRYLAHLTTGLLMLLIGLSLEMTAALANFLVGNFGIFNLALVILYLASVFYDFWDLERLND